MKKLVPESIFEAIKHLPGRSEKELSDTYFEQHFGEERALSICKKYLPFLSVEFIFNGEKPDTGITVVGDSLSYAEEYFSKWDILDVRDPEIDEDGNSVELIIGILPEDSDKDENVQILLYSDATLYTPEGSSDEDLDPVPITSLTKDEWEELYTNFVQTTDPEERDQIRANKDKWSKMKKNPNEPYYKDNKQLGLFDKEKHYQWDEEDKEWLDTQERSLKRDSQLRKEMNDPNWAQHKKDPNYPFFKNHKGWDVSSSKRGGRDWLWDKNKKEWISGEERRYAEQDIEYGKILSKLPEYKKEITEAMNALAKKYNAQLTIEEDHNSKFAIRMNYKKLDFGLRYDQYGLQGDYHAPGQAGGMSVNWDRRSVKNYIKQMEKMISTQLNAEWWKKVNKISDECLKANNNDRYAITRKDSKCYKDAIDPADGHSKLFKWSNASHQYMLKLDDN